MGKTSDTKVLTKQQYLNQLNRLKGQITALGMDIILLESEYIEKNKQLAKGQKVRVKEWGKNDFATLTGEIRVCKEGDIWYEIEFEDGHLTESKIDYLELIS